ncbi:hypothetical protein [Vibrio phage vB_VpaM_VPs20]|uniref:Uncharacterized protein n=1 Tax=Vibrio phage vB_VpaM_VPs20 TaxID=2978980 RepID=A0A9X9JPQ6_9CAUD|nr:hypothetical protein QNH06_gp17 [Vibrio phage vB_VpaM_VPs20]UYD72117.1 hypothetical protein [Vibrio phage vB_VpaM_VPs20]
MRLRNTTDSYQGFTVRLNPGEIVTGLDPHGNKISKEAPIKLQSIRIPPLAEVEIADHIWEAALMVCSKRQAIAIHMDEVQVGNEHKEPNQRYYMQTPIGDGVWKSFYPVREMVKSGKLEVTVKPELKLSEAELREAIEKEQGFPLPKEVDADKLITHYHKLFG